MEQQLHENGEVQETCTSLQLKEGGKVTVWWEETGEASNQILLPSGTLPVQGLRRFWQDKPKNMKFSIFA